MISILYPEICYYLRDLSYGLLPCYLEKEGRFILIIKTPKESILTAEINNQFKVYLIRDPQKVNSGLGIITAFLDNFDEPLTITTPLFSEDNMLNDIKNLFSQKEFDVYFFDENNHELMGARAVNDSHQKFCSDINVIDFPAFQESKILSIWQNMNMQFSMRLLVDDNSAYIINLTDRLYPNDFIIVDIREKFHGFNDESKNVVTTSLVRDENVGAMQERDVTRLVRRVFNKEEIYLNPYRADTNNELTDIMIITKNIMLFIQAKDSPNTEDILRRSIDRKRYVTRGQIKEATKQLNGALRYARNNNGINIKTEGKTITIPTENRQLIGLVIVKELFDDDYRECSIDILNLIYKLELPIGLLDYSQLHILTQNLKTPDLFVNSLYNVIDMALEHSQFPKSIFTKSLSE